MSTDVFYTLYSKEGIFDSNLHGPYEFIVKPNLDNWDGLYVEGMYGANTYLDISNMEVKEKNIFNTEFSIEESDERYIVTFPHIPKDTLITIQGNEYFHDTDDVLVIGFEDKEKYIISFSHFKYMNVDVEVGIDNS